MDTFDPGAPASRKSKITSVEEAVATLLPDLSESLWVGGMHMHNVPMSLVRECIRQGRRFETLYAGPSSSLAADLFIGAGLVERVVCGYLGYEHLGLAPVFRWAVEEEGRIGEAPGLREVVEADSGSMVLALQAGASGQPFAALPPGLERTSLPAASPSFYRRMQDPFTGAELLAVQAVRPSVALIHCQQSDEYGNGIFKGSPFADRLLALAAGTVLMQVEQVIDNSQVIKYPSQTGVPGFLVSAVVPVTFGCHPT
ncbi:MAG: hypothetical protein M3328_13685, partial [Chloroflexota bacterium]|nr:hypothetical protein [Chloroflexota bacterium]